MYSKTEKKEGNIFTKPAAVSLFAILCCALWGSASPGIKIGYEWFAIEGTGSKLLFAGYRFLLAGFLALLAASIAGGKFAAVKKSSIPYLIGQGVLQTTAQYVCFYIGLSFAAGSKSSVINSSNAFFSIIFAHILLKNEKITFQKILGCLIGFAGVIAINMRAGSSLGGFTLKGEGLVLMSSVLYGASTVTLKMIADREKPAVITAYQLIFGAIVLIIIGKLLGGHIDVITGKGVVLFLYLASLTTVSYSLWANLIKYNPVGKVSIYCFCIPVFGVLLSAIFLKEDVWAIQNLFAILLVSAGVIIVNMTGKKEK